MPTLLDLSTPAARGGIAPDGMIHMRVSAPLHAATAKLVTYATTDPQCEEVELRVHCEGRNLHIALPPSPGSERGVLRQCVEFMVYADADLPAQTFQVFPSIR